MALLFLFQIEYPSTVRAACNLFAFYYIGVSFIVDLHKTAHTGLLFNWNYSRIACPASHFFIIYKDLLRDFRYELAFFLKERLLLFF